MKLRVLLSSCAALIALMMMPSRLIADQLCENTSLYQYQPCGVVAATNVFTVNATGLSQGVHINFYGSSADFDATINARVFRGGSLVFTGPISPSNHVLAFDEAFTLVPADQLQTGDEIELVVNVADPNGAQSYYSRAQDFAMNLDGVNHVWARKLPQFFCSPSGSGNCDYFGTEDLPMQEGSDYDYNDFEAWLYGVDLSLGTTSSVPEPSSILLITGATLAFAFSKVSRFF
jgi:hypothetical protein